MALVRPLITETARPYWSALARERIEIQRCPACERWVFYPRILCPHCGGRDLRWQAVGGGASLYTFSVAVVPVSEDFVDDTPLIVAVAELDEGIRIPTTLTGIEPEAVRIGMRLAPVFDHERLGDVTLLRFRPAAG